MKYVVLLCDGMSDEKQPSLGNKTIMEYANLPNMQRVAKLGKCGFIQTTPTGFAPGSDICNMSIFGYDPVKYYTGRSPIEAISMGIELGENDTAVRCNLVTLSDNYTVMEDFSAHHINNKDSSVAIERVQELFKGSDIEFYKGLSYRHLLVLRNRKVDVETTPPHDLSGASVLNDLPKGADSEYLKSIMERAKGAFTHGDTGKANSIWLWGHGTKPIMPSFKETYGLKGAVVAAVDLIKGIGLSVGMDIINVPGVTGFIDTNFEGKARYGMAALKDHDYIFIHLEAPDESGHMGSIENKVKSLEMIDTIMLPIILEELEKYDEYRLLITPDHATPVRTKSHTDAPVPALIYGTRVEADGNEYYSENMKFVSFDLKNGYEIAKLFIMSDVI